MDIANEGFDDIYDSVETKRPVPDYFDTQVDAILKEAINPKERLREYVDPILSSKVNLSIVMMLIHS